MTLYTEGFRRVVAFPPAPIATGRSDPCRKGLATLSRTMPFHGTRLYALFPGTIGCVDPRRSVRTALRSPVGLHAIHQDLDADHGAPEPRDFSIRNTAARLASRDHSRVSLALQSPLAHDSVASTTARPAFVTIAIRPSQWDGMARSNHIFFENWKSNIFRGKAGQQFGQRRESPVGRAWCRRQFELELPAKALPHRGPTSLADYPHRSCERPSRRRGSSQFVDQIPRVGEG